MTTRKKKESASEQEQTKGRVKVGKLTLNKETVQEVGDSSLKGVKGGVGARTPGCVVGAKPDTVQPTFDQACY